MFSTWVSDLFRWSRRVPGHPETEASKSTPSDSQDLADLTASVEKAFTYATAQGSIGDVWKCRWNGEDDNPEVAVKCVRIDIPDETFKASVSKRLMDDISKWKQFNHECVLPLIGITYAFGPVPAIVSPWMDNGSLTTYLDRHHHSLSETHKLDLLADVAAGLKYLHSKGVAHADLTGNNVLVDSKGRARIADYCLSTTYADLNGTSYIRHNVRWVAPEQFEVPETDNSCDPPKLESDIYSFGCIIYQVLSGLQPYYDIRSDHQVVVAILRGIKPKRPSIPVIEDCHWNVIERCWLGISERPSISDIWSLMDHQRDD